MAEKNFEISPVGVAYVCDKCGKGEMEFQRNKPVAESLKWDENENVAYSLHKCTKCDIEEYFVKQYPTIDWRRLT